MKEDRERVTFWGLVALLLATTAAAYALVLGPEPGAGAVLAAAPGAMQPQAALAPPAAPAAAPEAAPPQATAAPAAAPEAVPSALAIATVEGGVTIVRRGVAGAAQPGDPVRPGDALVTGVGARAVLAGGACAVALEEGGRIDVKESTPGRTRLRLETGLVVANVRGAGRVVEIESAVDAVARTSGGALSVARSAGLVAAAVRGGAAELRAAGVTSSLADGEQASVLDGRPPAPPAPIPALLTLDVSWPEVGRRGRTNAPRVTVRGETAPGALVFLGEERVLVQPDGRFVSDLALREGRQRLAVRAIAVGDLRASERGPAVLLDTTAPEPKFDTRGLWTRQ